MITVELDKSSLNQFKKDLEEIKRGIADKGLNLYRAKKFREFAYNAVGDGKTRLVPLSSATIALFGIHNPEFLTGKLMKAMKVESKGETAIAGYWNPSEKVPGKNITYADLAIIQSTGYRIPLTGEKGRKVRAWLAMNGLGLFGKQQGTKTRMQKVVGGGKWLVVPPRPFMERTLKLYLEEDGDNKAVSEYIDNYLKKRSF